MGSLARKIRRNQLKKELGTNKIKQAFHEEFETLEAKIKREQEEKEMRLNNKKV